MHFDFLFPGKTKEKSCVQGIDDYLKRLRHYARVDVRVIKEKKITTPAPRALLDSNEHILKHVRRPTCLVMLDSTGKQLASEDLADLLTKWEDSGCQSVTFFVGSSFGISEELLLQADFVLSLSRMTFTHDMARFFLLEQLYRAYTIKAGTGYHK